MKVYYKFLADSVLELRGKEFWNYHRDRLRSLGLKIDYLKISKYLVYRIFDLVFNPKRTVETVFKRVLKPKPKTSPRVAQRALTPQSEKGN